MSTLLASPRQIPVSSEGVGKRIPTLDGWRGVAILLVLFDHIQHSVLNGYAKPWLQVGGHGVTIFLVLSGFLITTKLSEGPINLRSFYTRRLFRLMPAAWVYLAVVLLFEHLMRIQLLSFAKLRACLFFYRNFTGPMVGGAARHFWTLSLEEQFYLLWLPILLLAGSRRCRGIASLGALVCCIYRLANWTHFDHLWVGFQTQVRADALLIGCSLALLLASHKHRGTVARTSNLLAAPALVVLLFCFVRFHALPPSMESLSIAVLIASGLTTANPSRFRLLQLRPLAYLGTISYSVYLWQGFFLLFHGSLGTNITMMCLIPIFALASYYLIERPCTAFGRRLS
jgi:peptidoglycan/LPS O-acetylase OafA/YrhL